MIHASEHLEDIEPAQSLFQLTEVSTVHDHGAKRRLQPFTILSFSSLSHRYSFNR